MVYLSWLADSSRAAVEATGMSIASKAEMVEVGIPVYTCTCTRNLTRKTKLGIYHIEYSNELEYSLVDIIRDIESQHMSISDCVHQTHVKSILLGNIILFIHVLTSFHLQKSHIVSINL